MTVYVELLGQKPLHTVIIKQNIILWMKPLCNYWTVQAQASSHTATNDTILTRQKHHSVDVRTNESWLGKRHIIAILAYPVTMK